MKIDRYLGPCVLTKPQVADRLGVSVRSLERMIRGDLFPVGMKVGAGRRLLRWRVEDVERYLDQQQLESVTHQ